MELVSSDRSSITLVPFLHGKIAFAEFVRKCGLDKLFDCIAVDAPAPFEPLLAEAVDDLPVISAVVAHDNRDPLYFVPIDPCDAVIEAVRLARQNRIPFFCIGRPVIAPLPPLPPLPDEYAIQKLGMDAYSSLCLRTIGNPAPGGLQDLEAQYIAFQLHRLRRDFKNILAAVHLRHFTRTLAHFNREITHNLSFPTPPHYTVRREVINPDHLYFVLGELPFLAGKFEKSRYEPFSVHLDIVESIKDLFRETRDDYHENQRQATTLSPARIQRGLQFLRNMTVTDHRFMPDLFDIVTAAKGIGGNSYALHILACARYYPFLPADLNARPISVGIDHVTLPEDSAPRLAFNCFRDFSFMWKKLSIKPEPTLPQKEKYRFSWDPAGMCSHMPEDRRIETFNARLRNRADNADREDCATREKFTSSLKDGIDLRETLSKWYTGDLYVKELPPSRGKIDTVVIIFDGDHDELYPHQATWYAEHDEESTLTFYSTDPFANMIGPGIGRSYYGGLSLLFPPRSVPNIFELHPFAASMGLAECLTRGALLFSKERRVAFVSKKRPTLSMRKTASRLKKHLVWLPLGHFSSEALSRLRTFHVLNGKEVRSWATRYIGE